MAVRIRLARKGKKHQPLYRIMAIDSRRKRNGKALEVLGFYNPSTNPPQVKVDRTRFDYWLSMGAQPSDPVRALILGQKRIRTKVKKKTTEAQKKARKEKGEEKEEKGGTERGTAEAKPKKAEIEKKKEEVAKEEDQKEKS
jgi:small subunit ribosomal protein S16